MAIAERLGIIRELQRLQGGKILTLVTSDRYCTLPLPGILGQIAPDQVHVLIEHLNSLASGADKTPLSLFIYSRGGDVNTAWPLVNTIRSFGSKFRVLVPLCAHSAATLICLGADEIVMGRAATLSPVDPTVANAFNPLDPKTGQPLGISVEDVTSFITLAHDGVNINNEDNTTRVFNSLSKKVHPLALGNVKRAHTQIRLLAKRLLSLHKNDGLDEKAVDAIVDELTERLYTHEHQIFRDEAIQSIGLRSVVAAPDEEEKLMWALYKDYESDLQLREFFDPNVLLGDSDNRRMDTTTVMIESEALSSAFRVSQDISKALPPEPNLRTQVAVQSAQHLCTVAQTRSQIIGQRAQLIQMRLQLTQLAQQNPAYPALTEAIRDADNEIARPLQIDLPEIDLNALRVNIESKIVRIGWEHSTPS